jgi:cellulose synthase/poly-beta-1,6-N-acetylglucosamine synthase-like glycosyltransferase
MIEILFLTALGVMWALVLYTVVLTLAAYVYWRRRRRIRWLDPRIRLPDHVCPSISIIIPAHDEARVIERSLKNMLSTDYPADRLEVVVVNDASSDQTGEICRRMASEDRRIRVIDVPALEGGTGKSAALNRGLAQCRHPFIAVYDADNRPLPSALRLLMSELVYGGHDAVVGGISKVNRGRTLLNRFAALEFTAFQWILQGGRAQLFDLVLLPGTNFALRRSVVEEVGGWDPDALTEDLELSIRLYAAGHRIAFVPEAVAEEQDPEELRVWVRQRLRWVVGNFYAAAKHLGPTLRSPNPRLIVELLSLAFGQILFLLALLASDTLFVGGIVHALHLGVAGPYTALWILAFLLFVSSMLLTQAFEGQDTWGTPFLAGLMYVSYTQLWIYVALRGLVTFVTKGGRLAWEKTPRFHD